MVSDVEKKAVKAYGADLSVAGETIAKRITFVIGKNGKVLYSVFDWSPLPNVNKVYAWLKEHPQT